MRVFTVHTPPPGRPSSVRLLPEGWSWWGVVLGPAWLLSQGAWPYALLSVVALASLPWLAWPGVFLLIGLCGHDARRATLDWRGWRLAGVVMGADNEQAELRWFDRQSIAPSGLVR